jgi:putative nucleotidyltransferase with HDIG domain
MQQAPTIGITGLTELPIASPVAVRLLQLLDDPDASARELGQLIETDPALSMRVIRLANTPYYGLSRQIGSAWRSVTILGFATVRAVAASAAFGLFADQGQPLPPGFWDHAIETAAGASVVARRLGANAGDAFSAGLLHDIGKALLFRHAPHAVNRVKSRAEREQISYLDAERLELGTHHPQMGALALDALQFPQEFVQAVYRHHDADGGGTLLGQILVAGESLAVAFSGERPVDEPIADLGPALAQLGLSTPVTQLLEDTAREVETLSGFLGG